uniref:Uncharacterized protein n=1 Tax=Knipowitschia caucasica TaxID=637954 RepID=A0AAV2JM60_KNICA
METLCWCRRGLRLTCDLCQRAPSVTAADDRVTGANSRGRCVLDVTRAECDITTVLQPFISGQKPPAPKKKALDQGPGQVPVLVSEPGPSCAAALVESGPVQYDEAEEEEEEEEEEPGCVSAMELLGANGYGSEEYDDY